MAKIHTEVFDVRKEMGEGWAGDEMRERLTKKIFKCVNNAFATIQGEA